MSLVTMLLWLVVALVAVPTIAISSVAFAYLRRALYLRVHGHVWAIALLPLAGIVVREALTTLRVLGWSIVRKGERLAAHEGDGRPVVLVHGLSADGTSMFAARRLLARLGRKTYAPHMGLMFRPIEKYAARLVAALEKIDGPFDVVAHSMGGIVLRRALADRPDLAARVVNLVCVASPHQGTFAATRIPIPEARQLRRQSEWLAQLPTLRALLPQARITTVASTTDAVVYPHDTTLVDGGTSHEFANIGHAETLVDPRVLQIIVEGVS